MTAKEIAELLDGIDYGELIERGKVKDMFFREDEAVIQIHPPKSKYVNTLPNCLHLWRPIDEKLPLPPSFMVGLRKGETITDILEAIKKYNAER